jgi:nitroreductase
MTAQKTAATSVPVHPLLAQRWSPRGLDADHELDQRSVLALLEAARWAPSANNSQPWRFLVAHGAEEAFTRLLGIPPRATAAGRTPRAHSSSSPRRRSTTPAGRARGPCSTPARRSPRSASRPRPTD